MSGNTEFTWPWQYGFPPFFTLQKNKDVLKMQIDAWCNLVVAWGKHNNISQLDVAEAQSIPVFRNSSINRSLPPDSVTVILEALAHRGNLEWVDKTKRRAFLYWRSPAEWGQQIYLWAKNLSRINTVCTFYELSQGDDTASEAFHGLDEDILIKALRHLESEGKAEMMNFGDSKGVKFL